MSAVEVIELASCVRRSGCPLHAGAIELVCGYREEIVGCALIKTLMSRTVVDCEVDESWNLDRTRI